MSLESAVDDAFDRITIKIIDLKAENARLRDQVQQLEAEIDRIMAIIQENAQLRTEIDRLKARLSPHVAVIEPTNEESPDDCSSGPGGGTG